MKTSSPLVKKHWLDRAVDVHNFHCDCLKDNSNWRVRDTADALNRSVGSVSQDLLLAQWFRSHEKQLRKFRSINDALEFIRKRKKEINGSEIEI